MSEARKKAKLAHEKGSRGGAAPEQDRGRGAFSVKAVRGLVTGADGMTHAWVELDEAGTLGLVSPLFAATGPGGGLVPACLACPAMYDEVARERAIAAYERFASQAAPAAVALA